MLIFSVLQRKKKGGGGVKVKKSAKHRYNSENEEMKMTKTYSLYYEAALSCDYSRSAAAMGENILLQVTARAVEGLRKPGGSFVCVFYSLADCIAH